MADQDVRWGARPATKADRKTIRRIAAGAPWRGGARTRIIEVAGEPVGFVTLDLFGNEVRLRDVRFLPEWRSLAGEVERRLKAGAQERDRTFVPVDPDRPAAAGMTGAGCRSWLLFYAIFLGALFLLLRPLGLREPTGVVAPHRWIRPESLAAALWILDAVLIALVLPGLVSALRARRRSGERVLDLGRPRRPGWLLASAVTLAGALAGFAALGIHVPGGGTFGVLLLLPAATAAALALRKTGFRRKGILAGGLLGFVPFDSVERWELRPGRLRLLLAAPPGLLFGTRVAVAVPRGTEDRIGGLLRERLGAPGQVEAAGLHPFVGPALAGLLTIGTIGYVESIPRDRPPGPVTFQLVGEDALVIGRENPVALAAAVWDAKNREWEPLEAKVFDFPRERIDLVLFTRDPEGRPVETVSHVTEHG